MLAGWLVLQSRKAHCEEMKMRLCDSDVVDDGHGQTLTAQYWVKY
jgi:hypothetical protein